MKTSLKMALLLAVSLAAVLIGVGIGSVYVSPGDILAIFANRLFDAPLPVGLPAGYSAMVLDMRLPRVLLAFLTGAAVAFVGIIGFVDLIAPHIVGRWFGAAHRRVLPASALFGGTFLVLCDLAARTLTPPHEIPIGAITALLGAPFFLYVFFAGRKGR